MLEPSPDASSSSWLSQVDTVGDIPYHSFPPICTPDMGYCMQIMGFSRAHIALGGDVGSNKVLEFSHPRGC